jgi:hypothetical protein
MGGSKKRCGKNVSLTIRGELKDGSKRVGRYKVVVVDGVPVKSIQIIDRRKTFTRLQEEGRLPQWGSFALLGSGSSR